MKIKLVQQRICYRLTPLGWALILGANLILVFVIVRTIAVFLVVNKPLETEILIVDGMMPGYAYDSIVALAVKNNYHYLITAGVNMDYTFNSSEKFNTAEFSYKVLSTKKLDKCERFKAPASSVDRDRTFTSAMKVRDWFISNKLFPSKVNVVSFSCHSRRTWILYRKAFHDFAEVGIIAINDNSYDYNKWYRTSKGVRMILSETIGYLYTKIFFHPKVNSL